MFHTLLDKANAFGASFQGAKRMTPNQIRGMNGWENALYDSETPEGLHLPPNHNEQVLKIIASTSRSN